MNKITLHDLGFPGDELIAERNEDGIGIRCVERNDGDACALIDLTDAQARELAEWILGQVNS